MSRESMTIDAVLLIMIALAILVLLAEDARLQSFVPRVLGVFAGAFAFQQAMWLLGVWVPGASGFPLPRIGFDAAICLWSCHRAFNVARKNYCLRGRLAAIRRRRLTSHG